MAGRNVDAEFDDDGAVTVLVRGLGVPGDGQEEALTGPGVFANGRYNLKQFMELKAYKVKCVGKDGEEYEVGVVTSGPDAAKRSAEHSHMEGRHVAAKAVSCRETDRI